MIDHLPAQRPAAMPRQSPSLVTSGPALGSMAHLYCDDHDYGDNEFMPAVMRACLARRALPFYGLFGRTGFFSADRELADAVAQARTLDDVEDAIDYYWTHPSNRQWLRRVAGLRLSTQRLRRFAGDYLSFKERRPTSRNDGPTP